MNFGLNKYTISAIQSVFKRFPSVETAIIYGSRAKGNYRNGSDIDITLKGTELNMNVLLKIENEIDDLLLPYKIDLSVYQSIENLDFKDHIDRVGKIFYQKNQ